MRHASAGQSGSRERLGEQLLRYQLPATTLDRFPRQLSGGMAKRILACTAAPGGARYILADEITARLDEAGLSAALASCVNWPIRAAVSLVDPRSGAGSPLCRSHRGAASGAGERYLELPPSAPGRGARCSEPTGRRCRSSTRSSLPEVS